MKKERFVERTNRSVNEVGKGRETKGTRRIIKKTGKKRFKGRLVGPFQHCSRRLIVLLPPNGFLHSSPETPRATQARETSASEGRNYYKGI